MKNKKGFTLVELMIVIVVIGILAAMMMFSSTEAINEAKAKKLINDLQMLKRAALAYYADNYSRFVINFHDSIEDEKVKAYIGNDKIPNFDKFGFMVYKSDLISDSLWFVYYRGDDLKTNARLREKLETQARAQGFYRNTATLHFYEKGNNWTIPDTIDPEDPKFFEENIYKANAGRESEMIGLRIR